MNPFENLKLSDVKYVAIEPLLVCELLAATCKAGQKLSTSPGEIPSGGMHAGKLPVVTCEAFPLHRSKDTNAVLYISAIALKLAQLWHHSAMDIATAIAAAATCSHLLNAGGLDFTVKVLPPGWIHLQMTDTSIATWLQRLTQFSGAHNTEKEHGCTDKPIRAVPSLRSGRIRVQNPCGALRSQESVVTSVFTVQYAHARCCSLLRLAHAEGLGGFDPAPTREPNPQTPMPVFRAIAPSPIPWLDADGQHRLVDPAERGLISQLVTTLDVLTRGDRPPPCTDAVKLATNLARAFLTFHGTCRIWGEVKTETPSQARARLGLILATQPVLHLLLQDCLGVTAPLEL